MSNLNNDLSNYGHLYSQVVRDPLPINFGSVAVVCNIKAEKAKQILTDIFACVVELRRKHKSGCQIKIQLKNFGYLLVSKAGEFGFRD